MIKNNKLVIYHNDMNLIPLRKFTILEQNILYGICIKMRDENSNILKMTFEEIKRLSNYKKNSTNQEFAKELKSVYSKLLSINFEYDEEETFKGFSLFTEYEISSKKQTAEIQINEKFAYLLNNLTKNFTKFEMLEFSNLSSAYSKTAYKQLKQFRKTGCIVFEVEKFKKLFCIPQKYRMCDIDRRILKPIKNELSIYFKGLEINKITKGKGRTITHIEFSFLPENDMLSNGNHIIRDEDGYKEVNLFDLSEEQIKRVYPDGIKINKKKMRKNDK